MRVLQNSGRFEILTPEDQIRKSIFLIERVGRVAYRSQTEQITKESAEGFVRMLLRRGHFSVIEHGGLLTVLFLDVSRGFTHEMVRHRMASFLKASTRYIDFSKEDVDPGRFWLGFVAPPNLDTGKQIPLFNKCGKSLSMEEMFEVMGAFYKHLREEGLAPEDARQVLPIGTVSEIVVSANYREWRHIFMLRTSKHAHWEIRGVLGNLLRRLKEMVPVLFEDFEEVGRCRRGIPFYSFKGRDY